MNSSNDRNAWFGGGQAQCSQTHPARLTPLRLVLLGPPGVGKGTQAELLHQELGVCHLSTGDLFRAAKSRHPAELSPALKAALVSMERGELVSDQAVLDLVRERVRCLRCQGGFLLDGFPRTVPQAEALAALLTSEGLELDAVLSYELSLEEIVPRLSGRRVCSQCKAVFHVSGHPPKTEGLCDHCGGTLITRKDDQLDSVRTRMEAYQQSTRPLEEYYQTRGLLVPVSAQGAPQEILRRAVETLAARGKLQAEKKQCRP